jgi:DNA-binding CsgD family transcriptional regulator
MSTKDPSEQLLDDARSAYRRQAWRDAFALFSRAEEAAPLPSEDLELLAWSAALCGRDDELLRALERLHQRHMDGGHLQAAARAAFWCGFRLFALGEAGRATGWLARAQRTLEQLGEDCVIEGYLMLPLAHRHLGAGDYDAAQSIAARAAAIGERFADSDLVAFARTLHGRALVRQAKIADGLALLDEAMLAAANGELAPVITGLVYCTMIATCCQVYAMDRAREWTAALARWCDSQPQLVAFSGICMVHRAEIMQWNGAWPEAVAEAEDAFRHLNETVDREATAAACYQRGEIHRLRGEFAAAESGYREASRFGREPQPGLALLRLAQGRCDQAAAAIRRVVDTTDEPLRRAQLLPAYVEIMLAAGALDDAASAASELDAIARRFDTDVLGAMAAQAEGAAGLARGDTGGALVRLKESFAVWQKVDAPYIAARLRVSIAQACRELGDEDGATLELDAAAAVFERLGAGPDLGAVAALRRAGARRPPGGLTPRELEVLRLLAAGKTNRAIAETLGVSGKTVDRHVENIFTKLDVSSRAAATARGYERQLL